MKALRHIAGILLAALGIVVVLSTIGQLANPDPEIALWFIVIQSVVLGLFPLGGAFLLLRPALTALGQPCPQCGGREHAPAATLRTAHNPWLYHFGGWLLSSLWGASRGTQVRCAQCDALYLTETRATRIAGVFLWIFLLLVLCGLIGVITEARR